MKPGLPPGAARTWLGPFVIALAAVAAYYPSLAAPFIFDDRLAIIENPTIRHLWPLSQAWSPPPWTSGVSARPLVNFTFALNYALGGLDVRGYHAFNGLVHLLASLALLGVLRRTLPKDRAGLAFVIALLWTAHPLQTESVTCIMQRTEGLMGLFYLATLYFFIRSVDSRSGDPEVLWPRQPEGHPPAPSLRDSAAPRHPRAARSVANRSENLTVSATWQALSVICCLLGMATKEVMVTAPIVVFLYDRTFIAGSFAEAWRRRRTYYLALAATWLLLAALVVGEGGERGASAGFSHGVTSWHYALTQCWALTHYVRLAFWPHPLVLDYGSDVIVAWTMVWGRGLLILGGLLGTVIALIRRPAWGFLGATFFLLLGPSSSFVPLPAQTIAEHRMYLPLAVLLTAAMLALYSRLSRGALAAGFVAAIAAEGATIARNGTYASELAIWRDTVAHRPGNNRAHACLGIALDHAGRLPEAVAEYEAALRLHPDYADALIDLGNAERKMGRLPEAIEHFRRASALAPANAEAHNSLGAALTDLGRRTEAEAEYETALRLQPGYADAENNLGTLLCTLGRGQEGIIHLGRAVRFKPEMAEAHSNLGTALAMAGRLPEAIAQFTAALQLDPGLVTARANLEVARLQAKTQ